MKTWNVTALPPAPRSRTALNLTVEGRTKADAIVNAQKETARQLGLDRTQEALVKVEFKD